MATIPGSSLRSSPFALPTSVSVSGTDYPIRTDFRVILEILVMLRDPDLTDADKTEALIRMFYFEDPRKAPLKKIEEEPNAVGLLRKRKTDGTTELSRRFGEARGCAVQSDVVAAFVSFAQPRPPSRRTPGLVDWEQDFSLIAGPVNHILGTECRSLPYLHWWSFLAAYLEIGPETLFGRVLRIREKLRTGKKLEKYERSFLKSHYNLVVLPQKFSRAEDQILKDWA